MISPTSIPALDYAGVAVSATSGTLLAARRGMDLLGAIIIAAITAVGGGTLRDLLLDRHPIFWLADSSYLLVIVIAVFIVLLYARYFRPPGISLLVADTFGLALFTISGAQIAERASLPAASVALLGTMTGVAGGAIRDVICAEVPFILRRDLYATACLVGGSVYALLAGHEVVSRDTAAIAGMLVIIMLRFAAIKWNIELPRAARRSDLEDSD